MGYTGYWTAASIAPIVKQWQKEVRTMFKARINTSDLEAKLNQVTGPDLIRDIAEAVADQAVIPAFQTMPAASGKKMNFVSNKQRAFVMAAIKSGAIQVPYRRTGKIGDAQKQPNVSGLDVTLPVAYSDLVRTRGQQAKYHTGTWEDDVTIAERIESQDAERIGEKAVIDALSKAGLT